MLADIGGSSGKTRRMEIGDGGAEDDDEDGGDLIAIADDAEKVEIADIERP